MAAIPSNLTSLDFTEIRESIRSYLRTRDEFTDYDFDGSAASYLLDVLSYNTYYASFTANMAMNEAFLESATIRDNVVKIANKIFNQFFLFNGSKKFIPPFTSPDFTTCIETPRNSASLDKSGYCTMTPIDPTNELPRAKILSPARAAR